MKTIEDLFAQQKTSQLVIDILNSQELSYDQVDQILNDKKYPLEDNHLNSIIDRIYKAKAMNEKVVIVGDYDADGIMSVTILHKALTSFGIDVGFYIPNRLSEGYGINENIVRQVSEKGYSLIITVDNGVVAYDALNTAKALEIDVIVTDHHKIDESLNYKFDYILHPKYLPNGYNDLCGAGLALIIADKLLNSQNMGEYYVYAMVATIADMVSVFGFNRNIIKNGLYYINKQGNQHVENLIHYRNGAIDQQIISFQVVPKLNSFGRLADIVNVNNIVRYFLLDNDAEIIEVAKSITKLNQDRIELVRNSMENSNGITKYGTLNIIVDESIHEGITGLIAGRHMNKLNEPVLVLTKNENMFKGSGRSPKGYDIHALLNPLSEHFDSFGGHSQACGIGFEDSELENILGLIEAASKDLKVEKVDAPFLEVDVQSLNSDVVHEFMSLEPYGVDFIKPLLKVDVDAMNTPTLLKEKYLKWTVSPTIDLLCFDSQLDLDYFKNKKDIQAYVDLSLNEFRGRVTVNLIAQHLFKNEG